MSINFSSKMYAEVYKDLLNYLSSDSYNRSCPSYINLLIGCPTLLRKLTYQNSIRVEGLEKGGGGGENVTAIIYRHAPFQFFSNYGLSFFIHFVMNIIKYILSTSILLAAMEQRLWRSGPRKKVGCSNPSCDSRKNR